MWLFLYFWIFYKLLSIFFHLVFCTALTRSWSLNVRLVPVQYTPYRLYASLISGGSTSCNHMLLCKSNSNVVHVCCGTGQFTVSIHYVTFVNYYVVFLSITCHLVNTLKSFIWGGALFKSLLFTAFKCHSVPVHLCYESAHGLLCSECRHSWSPEDEAYWLGQYPDFYSPATMRFTFVVLSEMSWQLPVLLPWNLAQRFRSPSGWNAITLVTLPDFQPYFVQYFGLWLNNSNNNQHSHHPSANDQC